MDYGKISEEIIERLAKSIGATNDGEGLPYSSNVTDHTTKIIKLCKRACMYNCPNTVFAPGQLAQINWTKERCCKNADRNENPVNLNKCNDCFVKVTSKLKSVRTLTKLPKSWAKDIINHIIQNNMVKDESFETSKYGYVKSFSGIGYIWWYSGWYSYKGTSACVEDDKPFQHGYVDITYLGVTKPNDYNEVMD
jgi:hypothetical protein